MLLQEIPLKEEEVKIVAKLKKSSSNELEEYSQFVSSEVGYDLTGGELIESIILTLLKKDRKFSAWKKEKIKQKKDNDDKITDLRERPSTELLGHEGKEEIMGYEKTS